MADIIGWVGVDDDGQASLFANEPQKCLKSKGGSGFFVEEPADMWIRRLPQEMPSDYWGVMPGEKKQIEGIVD